MLPKANGKQLSHPFGNKHLHRTRLTYDKAELKQTFPWEEIAGIALYKTYCFLYDKRGGEFLIVTSDEKVKESLLYYLNTKK
jgi:hypothetical protein